MTETKINIMGQEYVFRRDNLNNPDLGNSDGYCRLFDKEIVVRDRQYLAGISEHAKRNYEEHVAMHELVHAVAQECGAQYGENEDLVDWIAYMIPHVNKAIKQLKEDGVI